MVGFRVPLNRKQEIHVFQKIRSNRSRPVEISRSVEKVSIASASPKNRQQQKLPNEGWGVLEVAADD